MARSTCATTAWADLGLTDKEISDNLMFSTDKIGSTMTSTISKADGRGVVRHGGFRRICRSRRACVARTGYTAICSRSNRDDKAATGWNNLVFNNVSMPHVLWERSGVQRLVETDYDDEEKAEAAVIAAKGLAVAERVNEHKYIVKTLALDAPGTMQPVEYKAFVADLVNYLDYISEPARNKRINIGIGVLIYLGILLLFAYALKRAYWEDVH